MPRSAIIGKPPKRGKKTVKNSHTSPREIELQKKRAQALDYRMQGFSFREIGEKMGVHHSTVEDYVNRALDAITHEPARKVMAMELERLNSIQAAHYGKAIAGDILSGDMCMRVMDKRARYLGLYPSTKESTTVAVTHGANGYDKPDARQTGIMVTFVKPNHNGHDG